MKNIDLKLLNDAINGADIRQGEAATLFGISRQTLYSWREGRPASNDFIVDRAQKICQALVDAVSAKRLPLDPETVPSSRLKLIKLAMLGR